MVDYSLTINKVILSLMLIVLPALVGMYVLADPIYSAFYSRSIENANLLRFYLPLAVLYSIYSLTSIIMQAVNRQLLNFVTIIVGLVIKYLTITPFVIKFETNGVILSSISTFVAMIIINLVIINTEVRLKIFEFFTRLLIILSSCFIMFITISAIYESILTNFVIESKISSVILIMICATFGIFTYFFSITMMKFDEYLFGRKIRLSSLKNLRRRA